MDTKAYIEELRKKIAYSADVVAQNSRELTDTQYLEYADRYEGEEQRKLVLAQKKYGFTEVCNTCGSTNIGACAVTQQGEYAGTKLKCPNCGQEEWL